MKQNLRDYVIKQQNFLDKELDVSWDKLPVTSNIMEKLWQAIKDYQNKFNFSWFKRWDGYSQIRFNKYSYYSLKQKRYSS